VDRRSREDADREEGRGQENKRGCEAWGKSK
jgi:hypothetical protein